MNLIAGLALAAFAVSVPAAKPTVTMMSYFWSTKDWMFLAMSADTALVAALGVPPTLEAPSWAPSHEYWLKFLSSRLPTSVTSPIFGPAAPVDGPVLQAEIMRVSPANRARPSERVRMLPPSRASMTRAPVGRTVRGSRRARRSAAHAGAAIGAHPSGGHRARQAIGTAVGWPIDAMAVQPVGTAPRRDAARTGGPCRGRAALCGVLNERSGVVAIGYRGHRAHGRVLRIPDRFRLAQHDRQRTVGCSRHRRCGLRGRIARPGAWVAHGLSASRSDHRGAR